MECKFGVQRKDNCALCCALLGWGWGWGWALAVAVAGLGLWLWLGSAGRPGRVRARN